MHPLISEKRDKIAEICQRFGVSRLEVFGSTAGEEFDENSSDADFLVQFQRPARLQPLEEYFGLRAELSVLLDRPVDLIEPTAVQNPFFRAGIERSRELVYAA